MLDRGSFESPGAGSIHARNCGDDEPGERMLRLVQRVILYYSKVQANCDRDTRTGISRDAREFVYDGARVSLKGEQTPVTVCVKLNRAKGDASHGVCGRRAVFLRPCDEMVCNAG